MTRAPHSPLPYEPLDAEEARAARIYRALPDGEPPATLDARILAQAREAVRPKARTRKPWFLGAGLGTAAAAVLAAGIAWQVGVLGPGPTSPGVVAPAATSGPDRDAREDGEEERVEIEFYRREQPVPAAPPPPPPEPVSDDRSAPRAARKPVEAPAAPAAPPAPPPPQAEAAPETPAAMTAPAPFPAEPPPADRATRQEAAAPAGMASESKRAATGVESEGAALERIEVTGSRLRRAPAASLPHWTEDATLPPERWLDRVHERVHAGDRQGAELSLRRFVLLHPRHAVPADLRRLLVE